jgi:hypothetical protein
MIGHWKQAIPTSEVRIALAQFVARARTLGYFGFNGIEHASAAVIAGFCPLALASGGRSRLRIPVPRKLARTIGTHAEAICWFSL